MSKILNLRPNTLRTLIVLGVIVVLGVAIPCASEVSSFIVSDEFIRRFSNFPPDELICFVVITADLLKNTPNEITFPPNELSSSEEASSFSKS